MGLPPNVEMVAPFMASATSGFATVRPMGNPLPNPLALVITSGVTPYCSMPNHLPPVRPQAVCTSSLMTMPQRHNLARPGEAARRNDSGLVGLGPAAGEKRFRQLAFRRDGSDFLRQRGLRLVGEYCGNVLQRIHLFAQLRVDGLIAVADTH